MNKLRIKTIAKQKDGDDFFDYLNDSQKEEIMCDFPDQYKKYLLVKKASKYNI